MLDKLIHVKNQGIIKIKEYENITESVIKICNGEDNLETIDRSKITPCATIYDKFICIFPGLRYLF
jgi:hypothetical protein